MQSSNPETFIDHFFITLSSELRSVPARATSELKKATDLILGHQGKIITCGIGKSGHIAKKSAATFSSTGTPAAFLHASEAAHGDLGIYEPGDPTILFSNSGATDEIVRIIPILKQFKSPIIAIVGKLDSLLAKEANIVIDASIQKEVDHLEIVPTTSVIVSMAIADALASSVMYSRSFKKEDFARFHPAGQLGRNLTLTVQDVMHCKDAIAVLRPEDSVKSAIILMTERPMGAACIVDDAGSLVGLLTDGGIRRALQEYDNIKDVLIKEVMTTDPKTIDPLCFLGQAIELMENRERQLTVLPVVSLADNKFLGLIRIHDIYQPNS